jgi:hypothetical protein
MAEPTYPRIDSPLTESPLTESPLTESPLTESPDYLTLKSDLINLYASIHKASYQFLKLIQILDEHSLATQNGFISTSAWLGYYLGIGPNAAREKVRVARAIEDLPQIDSAFAEGRLSYSKVRALTRVATPDNEARLLYLAQHATAHQVELIVRDQQRINRGRAETPASPAISLYQSDSGWVLKGHLPAEMGALLHAALRQCIESSQPGADDMPVSEKRAYALLDLVDAGRGQANDRPVSSADRYLVHIDHDDPTISQASLEKLICDASTVVHAADEHQTALNVGRKTRTIPPAIRRALHRRDKGCRFPGCSHRRFVDAHHVHHWAQGGETRLDNLILLCPRHHSYIHERNACIEVIKPDQGAVQFRFYDTQGQPLLASGDGVLAAADVVSLKPMAVANVTAVTSADVSPFAPINPTARADYQEIAWYLNQPRE